ncbi:hypothetical protein [Acinetobacter entericus]|uniref:Uncharacterized protein n=1 Tax=Acinetobacter entericus TaxID=2989714 RepID=A0ABT3NN77_9GAMM|nr:hypothetical protein [Acinetobacter entericus]MCW8041016.1 hypothetical protein [Acinetobacter entericus]
MKNIYLETLASVVCSSEIKADKGVPITLCVKGMLITGDLISKAAFIDDEGNIGLKALRDRMIQVAEEHNLNETEEVTPDYEFEPTLYLKNAKYFSGGNQIPTNGGALITVDLNSVDAFSMGRFEQQ